MGRWFLEPVLCDSVESSEGSEKRSRGDVGGERRERRRRAEKEKRKRERSRRKLGGEKSQQERRGEESGTREPNIGLFLSREILVWKTLIHREEASEVLEREEGFCATTAWKGERKGPASISRRPERRLSFFPQRASSSISGIPKSKVRTESSRSDSRRAARRLSCPQGNSLLQKNDDASPLAFPLFLPLSLFSTDAQ